MSLAPGSTLGSYQIVSTLGAGGMGEVYRARDSRLGREVAIKLLLERVSTDPERLARFEREARVLASLNHPNVATLHGFETAGETSFLVMELVPGPTLADRIARGPIAVDEAVPLFLQIAEGLEAAHRQGVVHRDLKPANIKIGSGDRPQVKILDFGLAKAMARDAEPGDLEVSSSPTLTLGATQRGEILGTAAYMSPEQASGASVDARADIWAFGCCLFEALTGHRPFLGEDAAHTLAAVLKDEPDWSAIAHVQPAGLQVLVRRCLEKKRRSRLQSIGDARVELQEVLAPPAAVPPLGAPPVAVGGGARRGALWAWTLAGLAVGAALTAALFLTTRSGPPLVTEPTHLELALPEGVEIPNGFLPRLAISPAGRRIAFGGVDHQSTLRLFVLDLSVSGPAWPIEPSVGAYAPFFSPDGRSVGYLQANDVQIVSLGGGRPRSIASLYLNAGSAASWGDDGWLYFTRGVGAGGGDGRLGSGIFRTRADGGSPEERLTTPAPGASHQYPQALPGGAGVLYAILGSSLDYEIAVTSAATGEETILFEGGFYPRYVEPGYLLVAQEDVLLGMTLDLETLRVGPAVAVLDGLITDFGEGYANYDVTASGDLVYLTGSLEKQGWLVRLVPGAEPLRLHDRPFDFDYVQLDLSPDGSKMALSRNQGDVWIFDLARRDLERKLTARPESEWGAVWRPGGDGLAFSSTRSGGWSIWYRSADGLGEDTLLVEDQSAPKWPRSWTPNGETLLYEQADPERQADLWVVPFGHPDQARPLLDSTDQEWAGAISPDGHWLAYTSNESGNQEVYVTRYPERDPARKVSRGRGMIPRWSASSERLYYENGDRVMVVSAVDDDFTPGEPEVLVEGVDRVMTWDVAPDGRSVVALERRPPPRLHLVQNWVEELKRRVPGG